MSFAEASGYHPMFVLFMLPIIFCSLTGGLGPGLLSTAISALGSQYPFIEPVGSFAFKQNHDIVQWIILILCGVLVSLLSEHLYLNRNSYIRIIETANEGIWRVDNKFITTYVNSNMANMLGYKQKEMLGRSFFDFIFPEDRKLQLIELQQIETGTSSRYEQRLKRKDGSEAWFLISACPLIAQNGVFQGSFAMFTDINTRKLAEQAIQESEKRFRRIVETANEGIWSLDQDIRTVYVNSTMELILGYPPEEMLGRAFVDFMYPEDYEDHESQISQRRSGVPGHYERRFRRKDGSAVWCHVSASSVMGEDGSFQGSFAMITNITERKQLEEQLLFRALHDPLTGLANRTLCQDRIAQANERAARKPESYFSVVFIDLDRFKFINDSLGHEAGDHVLCEIGHRLLSCARRADTVCRYGGDEFILVLEDLNKRETVRIIKRVRDSLNSPLTIGLHEIHVGASYGIAYAPQENCQPEELLRNANIALHCAKIFGKDRIVAYRKGMHEAAIHTMSFQSDMRRGLDADEFFMMYQPIFNLKDNCLVGFEALIRWNHPQRGIVGPGEFIPMAEEHGFIFELGNFALRQTCMDMVGLLHNLPTEKHLTVSVNLSPKQFSRQGLADQIEQTLIATGLSPSSLILEITESSIMTYPEASAHILTRLKSKGVGIAIDDFGTGYSSMNALQKLPLDRLKVDMSFVRRMSNSIQDREIVRAIITLARSLRFKTVAEGIETETQLEVLREMHCDFGQGYLYSRPLLLDDVPRVICRKVCA
jgi:diguanylate cyclase (GGDEF)-like protein/PAS domain S-box-containing protein